MSKENRVVYIGFPQISDSVDMKDTNFYRSLEEESTGVFMDDLKSYLEAFEFDVELHVITQQQLRRHQLVHSYHSQQHHNSK